MSYSKHFIINSIYAKLACMGIISCKVSLMGSVYYKLPFNLRDRRRKGKTNRIKIRISCHSSNQVPKPYNIVVKETYDIWKVIDYITDFYY